MNASDGLILGLICGTISLWCGAHEGQAAALALAVWTYVLFLIDDEDIL